MIFKIELGSEMRVTQEGIKKKYPHLNCSEHEGKCQIELYTMLDLAAMVRDLGGEELVTFDFARSTITILD